MYPFNPGEQQSSVLTAASLEINLDVTLEDEVGVEGEGREVGSGAADEELLVTVASDGIQTMSD